MRQFLTLLTLLFLSLQSAVAQDTTITLDGEAFTEQFVIHPPSGNKHIEFVRKGETFKNWTKLVGFHYQQLPGFGNDPGKVGAGMAQIVKAYNASSQSRVIVNKQNSEALIDFLTWPPDAEFLEFNVIRYAKSADGKAVVSVQFSYRLTGNSALDIEQFRKIRASWIEQAEAFDINKVHAALAH